MEFIIRSLGGGKCRRNFQCKRQKLNQALKGVDVELYLRALDESKWYTTLPVIYYN